MDDLFHSLASIGHGTRSHGRLDGASTTLEGAAFGATFDEMGVSDAVEGVQNTGTDGAATAGMPGDDATRLSVPDAPPTSPMNEVDGDAPLATLTVAGGAQKPETPSPTHIAINAQFADVRAGARVPAQGRTSPDVGPPTSPISTQDPDQSVPTPPRPGNDARPVQIAGTAAVQPNPTPVAAANALGGERTVSGMAQPTTSPALGPSGDEAPLPQPNSARGGAAVSRVDQSGPPTIPPSDRAGVLSQPLTIPPADPRGPQVQPLTTPVAPTQPGSVESLRQTTPPMKGGRPLPDAQPKTDAEQQRVPPLRTQTRAPDLQTAEVRTPGTATLPQSPDLETSTRHTKDAARDAPAPRDGQPIRIGGWTIAPAGQPAPVITAPPPTATQSLATTISAGSDAFNDTLPDLDFALQAPSSVLSTTALTPSTSVLSHAPSATAQTIAQQISAAFTNRASENADTPLELALDPPELGRVRMQISDVSGVMTLVIQAERPETADLMRRHLELLAEEFAQAGLNAPSVQIRQEGDNHGGGTAHRDASDGPSNRAVDPDIEGPRPLPQRTATGGLDLRL